MSENEKLNLKNREKSRDLGYGIPEKSHPKATSGSYPEDAFSIRFFPKYLKSVKRVQLPIAAF